MLVELRARPARSPAGHLRVWWQPVHDALGRDRPVEFPWVAAGLAAAVLAVSVVVGAFAREIPASLGNALGVGWPTLRDGRWWTLATSFALTRDWFMAATMPVCLFAGVALYERRAGHARAFTVVFLGHATATVIATLTFVPFLWTHVPALVHAADNVDYGASMAIAACLGGLLAVVHDRRLTLTVLTVAALGTLAHHQMSDWGHVVALPLGYWFARVGTPRRAAALGCTLVVTTALAAFAIPLVAR